MGNGLGVTALTILATVVLWVLGGLNPEQMKVLLSVAWTAFASLACLSALGFRYFVRRIGVAFGLIALLVGIATPG